MFGLTRTEMILIGLGALGVGTAIFWPDGSGAPANDDELRADALALLRLYLPTNRGDAHFNEMAKDYGGVGTTCGYLPSFMLYRMGVRDGRIVNRIAPDIPTNTALNTIGKNIEKLGPFGGGGELGVYHPMSSGLLPKPADILYFGVVGAGGAITKEHVAVLKRYPAGGNGTLVTYDLGHSGSPEGSETSRSMTNGIVNFLGSQKTLIGFVDISGIPRTAAPDFSDHTALVA